MNQANSRPAPTASRVNLWFVLLALMAALLLGLWLWGRGDPTPAERTPGITQEAPPVGQSAP